MYFFSGNPQIHLGESFFLNLRFQNYRKNDPELDNYICSPSLLLLLWLLRQHQLLLLMLLFMLVLFIVAVIAAATVIVAAVFDAAVHKVGEPLFPLWQNFV